MRGPVPPGQHGRDMVEALGEVLQAIAKRDPRPLTAVLNRNDFPADPEIAFVAGALAEAPKGLALPPLLRALKHADPMVRWSSAEALVRLRSKRALPALVDALRDRSPAVRMAVVAAMHRSRFFRTPAAIEPLRRIVATPRLQRTSPGLCRMAAETLLFPEVAGSAAKS
jgi:HEAT repeat protein